MIYRLIIVMGLISLLSACAVPKQPPGYNISPSQASLAEASYAISRANVELAETAQAAHPLPDFAPPPAPASYGMGGLTSIDWSGPIEPLLQQIANAANYRLRILGTPPAIPVLVTVYANNAMLGDVLRNAGYQCGRRATVVVFADSRVIELRYAKN
jgi:defect-in-organelle-trafficking protein DotD